MASNITLSAGVRQNLLALQNTASLLSTTQNRLATGKKVNSALDNPTNFFTSSSLVGTRLRPVGHSQLDGERHQHAEGRRQRPDLDHQRGRVDAGDRQPGASGQPRSRHVVHRRPRPLSARRTDEPDVLGGAVGTTPVNVASEHHRHRRHQPRSTVGAYAAPVRRQAAPTPRRAALRHRRPSEALTSTSAPVLGRRDVPPPKHRSRSGRQDRRRDPARCRLQRRDPGSTTASASCRIETVDNVDGDIAVAGAGKTDIFGAQVVQTGSNGEHNFTVNGTADHADHGRRQRHRRGQQRQPAAAGRQQRVRAFDARQPRRPREGRPGRSAHARRRRRRRAFTAATNTGTAGTGGSVKTVDELVDRHQRRHLGSSAR